MGELAISKEITGLHLQKNKKDNTIKEVKIYVMGISY